MTPPGSILPPPGGGGGPIIEADLTVFPDVYPSEYSWEPSAFQSVLDLANGSRQVTEFFPDVQRVFSLRYAMEDEDFLWRQLMPHFRANKARPFFFFDFWSIPWPEPLPFASGDEITDTFYVPAKEIEGLAITVDGELQSGLSVVEGQGPAGEAGVSFPPASIPSFGASLAWAATRARRKFAVWYYGGPNAPAKLKPVPVDGGVWGAELQLIEELQPA